MTHLGICSCNEAFIKYFEIIFYKCIKKKKTLHLYKNTKTQKDFVLSFFKFKNWGKKDYKFFIIFDIFN